MSGAHDHAETWWDRVLAWAFTSPSFGGKCARFFLGLGLWALALLYLGFVG